MKVLATSALLALICCHGADAAYISPLTGVTTVPQTQMGIEWFSRYDGNQITRSQFEDLHNQPTRNLDLFATADTIKITYIGTGAARNSELFLAGTGSGFDTASFWNPIYASGGTNNLGIYNPVNSSNELFQTRAGCEYASAKAGNTCLATEVGMSREISGLTEGERLVFGLQAWRLVYDGINLPNTNYFFTGPVTNNSDARGWNDSNIHAKLFDLGGGSYLVGFEDQWLGTGTTSDRDYNDMVFRFDGVTNIDPTIPEPDGLTLVLSGLGLLGLGLRRLRVR